MNTESLVRFFEVRRARGEPLVLVTIYETSGSTYSKAGTQMLIDGNGNFHGMLSGGCLEGDLALRAAAVIESGTPQAVTYDLAQGSRRRLRRGDARLPAVPDRSERLRALQRHR